MSSNSHQALKDVRKAGTARTDQDQTFKKPFQAVDHLPTVHHNMHDDFVRDPPKNVPEGEGAPRSSLKWPARDESITPGGVLGQEALGRIKHLDTEGVMVEESTVYP